MRHTRTLKLASAFLLSLSLAACGGNEPTASTQATLGNSTLSGTVESRAAKTNTSAAAAPAATSYPDYNPAPPPPDGTGMWNDARQLSQYMRAGWNAGNTMEAIGGETAWGNPKIAPQLIALVKQSGFNTIRLPLSWDQYANQTTGKISEAWLARVKEVVKMCVDADMFVIVNIHWDGGWLENNVTPEKQAAVGAKQKAYWQQIAVALREFDQRLLFASANEPNVNDSTGMSVLMAHHQTFVDTVRSTGGRNAYRTLIVQGPNTDIDTTSRLMTGMPRDSVSGRMMAEVHFYPYQFALMTQDASWGKPFYYWGSGNHSTTDTAHNPTWGEEAWVDQQFATMKRQFVDRGYPVVIGEYGAVRRTHLTGDNLNLHLRSRAHYLNYVNRRARANGMIPVYWDAGNLGENTMSLFDRRALTVYDQQALNAVISGSLGGSWGY